MVVGGSLSSAEALVLLVLAGFTLIAVGMILLLLGVIAGSRRGGVEAGGVVIIGPVPIVFGSRRLALPALVAGVVLAVLAYLLWWLAWQGPTGSLG